MRGRLVIGVVGVVVGVLLSTALLALAGNPAGPGTPPGETDSYTLADIYHSLNTGAAAAAVSFTEPDSGPGTATMYSLDEIYALTRQRAPVPETGQTVCWDSGGGTIDCAGTGQDGEYQKGVAWPSPRLTDNGDGTVTDNLTGLIWLQNANCFGTQVWASAFTSANTLNSGECDLSDGSAEGDWRLPNLRELLSIVDLAQLSPALPSGHPFTGVQSSNYWSSTSRAISTDSAWFMSMNTGSTGAAGKLNNSYYVWSVRGGQ